MLSENTWSNLVNLAHELEHRVLRQMLLSKRSLCHVAGVRLAENGMAISGYNLASFERGPEVISDGLIAEIIANGSLHLLKPEKYLLVGETVQGTGEAVETSRKREHGRAESASNQVSSVGTDVPTLVVSVDGEVKSQQLNEVLVASKAQLVGKVETVVLVLLDWSDLAALENVLVNSGGNRRELSNQVHRVLEGMAPIFRLPHSLSVCFRKGRFMFEGIDCDRELRHRMEVAWASVDKLLNEFGDI